MSCLQALSGLQLDCGINKGGIKRCWIANYDNVSATTLDSGSVITAVTMTDSAKFKLYEVRRNTSSMNHTLNVSEENGTNFVTSDLSLVFIQQNSVKRMEMSALSKGYLSCIVEDKNGIFWMLGIPSEEYVHAKEGTGETGTAKADRNGYTITLTTDSGEYPYEITRAAVEAVVDSI